MTWALLTVSTLLLLPAVVDGITKPNLRRFAWRNLTRRRLEAGLVTLGTLLGTAIIVASLVVGDTIEDAVQSLVYTSQGPLDEAVTVEDPAQLGALESAIRSADIDGVDGVASILSMPTAVTTTGTDAIGRPQVWVAEIDFDEARAFGGDPAQAGFADAGATPSEGEVVLTEFVADPLGATVGDELVIHAYGTAERVVVRDIIDRSSLAGWNHAYVAPGTITGLYDPATAGLAQPPRAEVVVSNRGDLFEGAAHSDAVVAALETATAHLSDVVVDPVKASTLEAAESDGAEFTTLFSGIGAFAVIAGVLLIVNLFVMLAEERKSQLGTLRAIGFRRHQVVRALGIEGAVYATTAALVGTATGVGVGWVIVQVIRGIFFEESSFLDIGFDADPASLLLGGSIGFLISMATIWLTATRIARFNVIAAIRDQTAPPHKRSTLRSMLVGAVGVLVGVAVTALGFQQEIQAALVAGPPIAAFGAIPLGRLLVPERVATTMLSAVALGWGVLVFAMVPDIMNEAGIEVFVVQGVVLVAAAVLISNSARRAWSLVVDASSRLGAGLSTRLGLVYPTARRGRTGLLLAMFSLVIFTITFLSVFSAIFGQQTTGFADEARAGYDITLASSVVNPVEAGDLLAIEGVASASGFVQAFPEFETDDDPQRWALTGFDESLLAFSSPTLGQRSSEYETDADAFRAVLADPDLVIVNDFFLQDDGGPGGERVGVGETVTVLNSVSDERHEATVVGVLASDFPFAGAYMGSDFVSSFLEQEARPGRFYVAAADGVDPEELAGRLNAALIGHGVDAATFSADVEAEVSETVAIFRLFQGFLSLGLVIGIAGLSVVLVRAVRERRRSIGVLRALGFPEKTIRRSFLVEALFLAGQGVGIGIGLGLLTAYQVIFKSDTFGESDFAFVWPWTALGIILVIPTLAALAAALGPAARAARIAPAVALRTE